MTPAVFRQIRKDLKLTQAQLAEKLGVHPITISHYETGARKITYAMAIAVQTFRLDADESRLRRFMRENIPELKDAETDDFQA